MPAAEGSPAAKRPSRWLDRIIGVVLGIVLGIGVIVIFVFESSEDTIDAARISGVDAGTAGGGPQEQPERVPLVRVIDGKPPPGGPPRLDFEQGANARFVVGSDLQIEIAVTGYGVTRTVGPGRTLVAFKAQKSGQYAIVVSASKIHIATLRVAPR